MALQLIVVILLILISSIFVVVSSSNCNDISQTSIFNEEIVSKLYFEPDESNESSESNELNDEEYSKLSQQYSIHLKETIIIHPSIIAMIENVDDIAIILSYASLCQYSVVIRSGGHQYSGLSSCNSKYNKCIQVDVSKLDFININTDNNIVSCGPGVTLLNFYTELSKNNIFLPAGVCQTVRLGGHVQTNGFGLLTRSIGLISDFIISFDIIIYNGTLIHVSKHDNDDDKKDLFFAVLGGNPGNFGIVVNYTFVALKDEDYINSTAIIAQWTYNKIAYKELMNAYLDIHDNPLYIDNNDVMLYVFLLPPPDFNKDHTINQHVIAVFGIWTKNISMNIVQYITDKVSDEPILYHIDNDAMSNLLVKNSFPMMHIQYPPIYLRAGYTKTNWNVNQLFIDEFIENIDYALSNNLYLQVLFQSYGGKNSALLKSNIGSLQHRDIFLALEMFTYYFENENDIASKWINKSWNKWQELLFDKDKIKLFFGTFGNHNKDNINIKQLYKYYYKTDSMYNKLRKIKTKFDPIDLFHYPLGLPLIQNVCDHNGLCNDHDHAPQNQYIQTNL